MSSKEALIIVLRRSVDDLLPQELEEIRSKFPDREVTFQTTLPQDYLEHADDCERLNPVAVVLPLDKPIPTLAMERGVPHIAFTPMGLMELESITPKFKEFVPR